MKALKVFNFLDFLFAGKKTIKTAKPKNALFSQVLNMVGLKKFVKENAPKLLRVFIQKNNTNENINIANPKNQLVDSNNLNLDITTTSNKLNKKNPNQIPDTSIESESNSKVADVLNIKAESKKSTIGKTKKLDNNQDKIHSKLTKCSNEILATSEVSLSTKNAKNSSSAYSQISNKITSKPPTESKSDNGILNNLNTRKTNPAKSNNNMIADAVENSSIKQSERTIKTNLSSPKFSHGQKLDESVSNPSAENKLNRRMNTSLNPQKIITTESNPKKVLNTPQYSKANQSQTLNFKGEKKLSNQKTFNSSETKEQKVQTPNIQNKKQAANISRINKNYIGTKQILNKENDFIGVQKKSISKDLKLEQFDNNQSSKGIGESKKGSPKILSDSSTSLNHKAETGFKLNPTVRNIIYPKDNLIVQNKKNSEPKIEFIAYGKKQPENIKSSTIKVEINNTSPEQIRNDKISSVKTNLIDKKSFSLNTKNHDIKQPINLENSPSPRVLIKDQNNQTINPSEHRKNTKLPDKRIVTNPIIKQAAVQKSPTEKAKYLSDSDSNSGNRKEENIFVRIFKSIFGENNKSTENAVNKLNHRNSEKISSKNNSFEKEQIQFPIKHKHTDSVKESDKQKSNGKSVQAQTKNTPNLNTVQTSHQIKKNLTTDPKTTPFQSDNNKGANTEHQSGKELNVNENKSILTDTVKHTETNTTINAEKSTIRVIQKVVDSIVLAQNTKEGKTVFKIDTVSLGKMQIEFKEVQHAKDVTLVVENETARTEVEKLIPRINEALAQRGIELTSIKIDINNSSKQEHQTQNSGNTNQNHSPTNQEEVKDEQKSSTVKVRKYGYNTMEVVA